MIDPQNAGMNPAISMPSRISPANQSKSVLITSVNKPKVKRIAGKVINVKIGLMKVFKKPMISEAMIAEKKFLTQIPSTRNCVRYTAEAEMAQRMKREVMIFTKIIWQYSICHTFLFRTIELS